MSIATNTLSVDADSLKNTQSFFNNVALPPISVGQNIDDAILGYFQLVSENKESARALAGAVILTSISQGIDPMETLDEFKKMSQNELNEYLTMFLNLSRVGTSYLGISNRPSTSKYIARMILP